MTYGELTRKLGELGYELRRQAKGGHEIWWHPQRKVFTTISHHGSKDIPTGTFRKILKDLGLSQDDFRG